MSKYWTGICHLSLQKLEFVLNYLVDTQWVTSVITRQTVH